MSESSLQVTNLSVKFGEIFALQEISLQLPTGAFMAIVGPNGAGKSTFLKVLLGLISPWQGEVRLYDKPVTQVPPEHIGYVPQFKTMDRNFPALAIELVLTGVNRVWPWKWANKAHDKAYAALQQVGAEHLAERSIGKLSGGELQRICLARSIVREPKLVILDEPATGIDTVGEADMYNLLESYQQNSGATVIMITHDWHAATHHADYVLLLNKNQISFGPPAEALNEKNLRMAFGHIGHEHKVKFLSNKYD